MGKLPVQYAVLCVLGFVTIGSCAAERITVHGPVDNIYVVPEAADRLLRLSIQEQLPVWLEAYARNQAESDHSARLKEQLADLSHHFPTVLANVYEKRGPQGWWFDDEFSVSQRGQVLSDTLANAHLHALPVENYRVQDVSTMAKELEEQRALVQMPLDIQWTDEELKRLERFVQQRREGFEDVEKLHLQILELGVLGRDTAEWVDRRVEQYGKLYQTMLQMDLALSDGLIGYGWDQRVVPGAHLIGGPPEEDSRKKAPEVEDENLTQEERVARETGERIGLFLSVAESSGKIENALTGLEPPYLQYGRLVEAYDRYLGYCEAGGWSDLPGKRVLRRRKKGPAVDALRWRLAAEGYEVGNMALGTPFGEPLQVAVMKYQRTHQYEETGEVDKKLRKSLNVSCETRLAQMAVSIQKWRQTHIADPFGAYIFVNIPDFHGEYWEGGQLIHRFRVVVGNRKRQKWKNENRYKWATPELASELRHFVFNPYWHVPASIIEEDELVRKMEEDPEYAVKHHYEVIDEGASMVVRQLPGPWNALGKVKFVFKNPYNVYLHDTPQKSKFRYPVRSFSHGCMRVQDAMEFAELLLRRQGKWKKKYQEEDGKPDWWVSLPQPIPIYVEYYLVRVDDAGDVVFGSDVYRRDVYRIKRFAERLAGAKNAPHSP